MWARFSRSNALDNIADHAAHLQTVGRITTGGSSYQIGDGEARSFVQQLAFVPLAFVTALLRPFIFEVSSFANAVNALESTALLLTIMTIAWRRTFSQIRTLLQQYDILVFALCFTCLFAVGVGLSSTNLGTLSRYRSPMMPFYCLFLLTCLKAPTPDKAISKDGAAIEPVRALP